MLGSNGRSRTFISRAAASARLFQDRIPADSGSHPTVFNGSAVVMRSKTVNRAASS
jgi:hypothetical protein